MPGNHNGNLKAIIEREYNKRFGPTKGSKAVENIRHDLFGEQLKFVDDKAKRKAALCSRRAGKTYVAARMLVLAALSKALSVSVYIALSRKVARRLLWSELKRIDRQYNLGMVFNNTELEAVFPNGAQVWLTGANNSEDIDKLRGSAYLIAILDECASFGEFFGELVEEVLDPALADHDGTMAQIGTPSAACAGMFYEVTTQAKNDSGTIKYPGWSVHQWSILDNKKFPRWASHQNWKEIAAKWMREKKEQKGWDDDNEVYLREWRGQWVRSESSMVYRWSDSRNSWDGALPGGSWRYILGLDLGFDDPTAFSIVAFSEDSQNSYLIEDEKRSGMTVSDIVDRMRSYIEKYKPARIVADTGGLGKMIVEEIRKRYSLPVEAAEKTAKKDFIELFNNDLTLGRFLAKPSQQFVQEAKVLQWDEDRRKEDDRFDNHATDATLYAWRESQHWRSKPKEPELAVGTPEANNQWASRYEKRLTSKIRKKSGSRWFLNQ